MVDIYRFHFTTTAHEIQLEIHQIWWISSKNSSKSAKIADFQQISIDRYPSNFMKFDGFHGKIADFS